LRGHAQILSAIILKELEVGSQIDADQITEARIEEGKGVINFPARTICNLRIRLFASTLQSVVFFTIPP